MKILITGANGYLGQGVVRHVLDLGYEVVATDFTTENIDDRAEKMACDLFAIEDPYNYFKKPDVLLHLAWRDGFVHYSDAHINDLPKHYEFIKKFTQSDIKKIVGMGSMHEIGFFEGSINEDTQCNPVTPYGISKNALCIYVHILNLTGFDLRNSKIQENQQTNHPILIYRVKSLYRGFFQSNRSINNEVV